MSGTPIRASAARNAGFEVGLGSLLALLVGATAFTAVGTVLGGGLGGLSRNQVAALLLAAALAVTVTRRRDLTLTASRE